MGFQLSNKPQMLHEWNFQLHEWLKCMVNAGKYCIPGGYGNSTYFEASPLKFVEDVFDVWKMGKRPFSEC